MEDQNSGIKIMAPIHTVMRQYERQLLAARQLARFRARNRLAQGLDIEEPMPGQNRSHHLNNVVEELSLSLLISGNDFPVIEAIRKELSETLGKEIIFSYPPGKKLRFLIRENGKLRALTQEEEALANASLKKVTRNQVDDGMAYNPKKIANV